MKRHGAWSEFVWGNLGLLVGWLWAFPATAQCPNTIPRVSEYGTGSYAVKKVGDSCLPYTVNVKNTLPGSVNVLTIFDYKGGLISPDSLKPDTLHTYTRPGKYTIVQFSEKDGRKLIACPSVFVYDTLPPSVQLVPCGRNQAKLVFAGSPRVSYDSHWIDWGDGNIVEVSPYTQSVNHVFDTPPPHTVTVWGTVNPGLCRSREISFRFDPGTYTQVPSLESISFPSATLIELVVANPLRSQLRLYQKQEKGSWEETPRLINKEKETLRLTVDSLKAPCFRLQATDSCLTESYISETLCSVLLRVGSASQGNELSWRTQEIPTHARVSIWKDALFWKEIYSPGLEGYLADEDLSCGSQHCYQLHITSPLQRATSRLICQPTPSTFCELALPLFIPDAFSPNNDGINDVFEIKGEVPSDFELSIFSPWGTVLFHTTDKQQGWNGEFQNTKLPPGTYPYSLRVKDPVSGHPFTKKGRVLLLK